MHTHNLAARAQTCDLHSSNQMHLSAILVKKGAMRGKSLHNALLLAGESGGRALWFWGTGVVHQVEFLVQKWH